jgi:hypothetical protein
MNNDESTRDWKQFIAIIMEGSHKFLSFLN